ncbi:hypothetical protein [Umezawaea tangerina]|uniref:Type II secretory pathway predicted ATPase ExeA n=1 Tax=Umezawaea tangerina TaxID=84725 RepID=A0A2T0SWN5_9PSEU|nr:hypothetical protein [Umezawaea tangerina]PRY37831.1 type II secretory pathway predicted ATPase ExeA [Umezawaea tangerina]
MSSPDFRENPFSMKAAARYKDREPITIETTAFRKAFAQLSRYLAARPSVPAENGRNGKVVAIVGDYGAGKTHLGVELQLRAETILRDKTQSVYVEANADGFLGIYLEFIGRLGLPGVRSRVEDYYADIVADKLHEADFGADLVRRVRAKEDDAATAVANFGLVESTLLIQAQDELKSACEHTGFGIALPLLLRKGFDEAVWSWLCGAPPGESLRDRGIHAVIDNEVSAMEALGAFALLYGRKQRKFVLVVDELEKTLPTGDARQDQVMNALRKLFETIGAADAMLVLIGLPEFLQSLTRAVRDRLAEEIGMSALVPTDVADFIMTAQALRFGDRRLAPFTAESVQQLVAVTAGNPRKIRRHCHQLYDEIGGEGRAITAESVIDLVRGQTQRSGSIEVRAAVQQVVEDIGLDFRTQTYRRADSEVEHDFIMTVDGRKCAVLTTSSILVEQDIGEVERRARRIRSELGFAELVVVVNGLLKEDVAQTFRDQLVTEPLVFVADNFVDELKTRLTAVVGRIRESVAGEPWTPAYRMLQQLDSQMFTLYGHVGAVQDGLTSVDHRVGQMQRFMAVELREMLRAPAADAEGQAVALPARVERRFRAILELLEPMADLAGLVRGAFAADANAGGGDSRLVTWLRDHRDQRPVITAVVVFEVVRVFHDEVLAWYSQQPAERGLSRLEELCRSFDSCIEYLPLPTQGQLLVDAPNPRVQDGGWRNPGLDQMIRNLAENVARELEEAVREDSDLEDGS